jgi:excisionase family DNA binding protein
VKPAAACAGSTAGAARRERIPLGLSHVANVSAASSTVAKASNVSRNRKLMKALSIKQPWAWLIAAGHKNEEMIDRTLTVRDVAERLGVSERTVLRRIEESGLAFARPGRSYVFDEQDYHRLYEAIRQCRSRSSRQGDARTTPTGSPEDSTRSPDEALRSLRRRETKRLLDASRKKSGSGSPKVVHLHLERP